MNRIIGPSWIALIGILCHGLTVKCDKVASTPRGGTSPNQFWACSCPPGSYEQGTQYVYASANLCQNKNTSFLNGLNSDFATTIQSEKSSEILTQLEVCSNCATGCAKCKGPEENECMECMLGYYAIANPTLNDQKIKREIAEIPVKTREIYEEEELLTMNLDIAANTAESVSKQSYRSNSDSGWPSKTKIEIPNSQNLHNSKENAIFHEQMIGMLQYDDEESSGEIDKLGNATEIHISKNVDIPEVISGNEDTKSKPSTRPPLKKLNKLNQQIPASVTLYTSMTSFSCLANCPHGFFNSSNRMCQSCHSECDGCNNNGPTNCIKCKNYKRGTTCVSSCNNNNGTEANFNENCEVVIEEEEAIPAGYYAIPPLIILFVIACLAISYYRRRQKMKNLIPTWRPEGMHKTDLHSSESTFSRTHVDPRKYFYKGNKPHSHIALAEFKNNSNDQLKRKGNPYVYTERPLLPKYAHQAATNSPAWSACRDMSEPEEDFDPLYETPDNTMDLEALKRYQKRRRSSPSHVHFAHSSSKGISDSHEDCVNNCPQAPKELSDTDGYSTENEYRFEEDPTDMEAPYYQAPPLPVRNSPSTQDILIDDHIYVNIDEKN